MAYLPTISLQTLLLRNLGAYEYLGVLLHFKLHKNHYHIWYSRAIIKALC